MNDFIVNLMSNLQFANFSYNEIYAVLYITDTEYIYDDSEIKNTIIDFMPLLQCVEIDEVLKDNDELQTITLKCCLDDKNFYRVITIQIIRD